MLLLSAGCASTGNRSESDPNAMPPVGATLLSPTLSRALADVIDEAVRSQAAEYGRVPRLGGRGDEIQVLVNELASRYPLVLKTTLDEEQQLREGRVDYATLMNELRGISRRVNREHIGLPIVSSHLLRQFERGQLVGVRLELAARLLRAQLDDPRIVRSGEHRRVATHQPEG